MTSIAHPIGMIASTTDTASQIRNVDVSKRTVAGMACTALLISALSCLSGCSSTSAVKPTSANNGGTNTNATANSGISTPPATVLPKIPHSVAVAEVDLSRAVINVPSDMQSSLKPQNELRGIAAELRAALIQQGFTVIQAEPADTADELSTRISKGNFGRAQYVFFGSLSRIDWSDRQSEVAGTNTTSHGAELVLSGDFSLVNTDTHEVRVAFSASGSGKDIKLLGAQETYSAQPAPMLSSAQHELIDNAIKRLREVGVLTDNSDAASAKKKSDALYKKAPGEDLQTLKIYR